MKKALLTIYVLFRILLVEGSHLNSEIVLKLQNGNYFTTSLNHYNYNNPVQNLHLSQVEPGRHMLKINELQFNSYYNNWFNHLIFNGYIDIPAATKVVAMIDNYGRFTILNLIPLLAPVPVAYYNTPGYYYNNGMTVPVFNNLVNVLQKQSFDSSKLKIAKQAISANKVNSEQVLQLMNLFTFESYKLDLAKYAYEHTTDKANYFILYDGFTFRSSIAELARHTGQGIHYARH